MDHLHLLIPDLFPPQSIAAEVCADLHLTALEKILARGAECPSGVVTLADWLCEVFAADGVAPVRAAADGLEVGEGYWLCADPVHLQLQHAHVMVRPDVAPKQEEATALCASLNEHFGDTEMQFFAPHPQRWYVQVETGPQLTTTPLPQVAWRDAKLHQPRGADAMHWQRVATEAQMLLHAHPVNQSRQARGEPSINSLWLWGEGRARELVPVFDALGGDSELARAFADAAGVAQMGTLKAMLDGECKKGLWVCSAAGEALQRGDLHAWREAAGQLERDCAEPLLKALLSGRLRTLTLEVLQAEGGRCFDLTRSRAWRWWRPKRPLAQYAV